jgi:4a-hydroxytetrahydrobiopterin dehydratase
LEQWECEKQPLRPISSTEAEAFLRDLPGWSLKDKNIEREFRFAGFKEAMEFVNCVALLAEAQEHHPDVFISYNRVRLTLSTHKIDALSRKDFVLAAMIDRLTENKDE